jgi:hypothetical protein
MKTIIERVGADWFCPWCKRCFKNRKGNLRNHLFSQLKHIDTDGRTCNKSIDKDILLKQLTSMKWIRKEKIIKHKNKYKINNFGDVEVTPAFLNKDWEYDSLQDIVLNIIKTVYLSRKRPKQNCIVTFGHYYKIKQLRIGSTEGQWFDNFKIAPKKFVKLTKGVFTYLITKKILEVLKNNYKNKLETLLLDEDNKYFYRRYMIRNKKASLVYQKKMQKLFREQFKILKYDNDETEIISFSTTSEESKKEDWFNLYNKMKEDERLNINVNRLLKFCKEDNHNRAISYIITVHNNDSEIEYLISRMPRSDFKTKLIEHFHEEINIKAV